LSGCFQKLFVLVPARLNLISIEDSFDFECIQKLNFEVRTDDKLNLTINTLVVDMNYPTTKPDWL